jgi:pimeloyl-ACP methyl ester carboxylesterase
MGPRTRYARNGDVHIAYQVVGEGPLDVVLIPGFISNVEFWWETPAWPKLFERLSAFARLILWDKRGTGLSDPVDRVPTLDDRAEDLEAVLEAAGVERAAIFGMSEGGSLAMLYAATRPERVSSLVLYGTTPRFMSAPDWPWGWTTEQLDSFLAELEESWGEGALLEKFAPSLAHDPMARELFGDFQRRGASPAMARAVMEAARDLDCRDVLAAIRVPTLVLHRTGDLLVDVEASRRCAQLIAGATFKEFPGPDHMLTLGDPGPVLDEIEHFLTGTRRPPPSDRILATVLFTDIVGSTTHAAGLGDRAWRELLERHHELIRRELERFGGREVKTLGDGFLATFVAPSRAITAACAIRDGVRSLGLEARAGLHTGECEVMGEDVAGVAVHTAARVAGLAAADEVWVSSTVRDLVAGSGLEFLDRDTHELKGVPGIWRLFSVQA